MQIKQCLYFNYFFLLNLPFILRQLASRGLEAILHKAEAKNHEAKTHEAKAHEAERLNITENISLRIIDYCSSTLY